MQLQIVTQDIQQRRAGIGFNGSQLAVHFQRDSRHGKVPFSTDRSNSMMSKQAIHEFK
jgi:hypothetical protein